MSRYRPTHGLDFATDKSKYLQYIKHFWYFIQIFI